MVGVCGSRNPAVQSPSQSQLDQPNAPFPKLRDRYRRSAQMMILANAQSKALLEPCFRELSVVEGGFRHVLGKFLEAGQYCRAYCQYD